MSAARDPVVCAPALAGVDPWIAWIAGTSIRAIASVERPGSSHRVAAAHLGGAAAARTRAISCAMERFEHATGAETDRARERRIRSPVDRRILWDRIHMIATAAAAAARGQSTPRKPPVLPPIVVATSPSRTAASTPGRSTGRTGPLPVPQGAVRNLNPV